MTYRCDVCGAGYDEYHPTCPACPLGKLTEVAADD